MQIKSKLIFLLLLFLNINITGAQEAPLGIEQIVSIEQQAEQWLVTQVVQLNSQEIQLLANLLYLSYANGLLDLTVRRQTFDVVKNMWDIRQQLLAYHNQQEQLIQLNENLQQLHRITQSRHFIHNTWLACDNYIEQYAHTHELFDDALEALRMHGQQLVKTCIHADQEHIQSTFTKTKEVLNQASKTLNPLAKMYNGLLAGHTPLPEEPENKEIAIVSYGTRLAQQAEETGWQTIMAVSGPLHYEITLEEISKIFYGAYYKMLYTHMLKQNFDAQLMTIMFSPEGLISENQRVESLQEPKAQAIVNQVLVTIKINR